MRLCTSLASLLHSRGACCQTRDAAATPALVDERIERYLASRAELRVVAVRGQVGGRAAVPLLATRTGQPIAPFEVFRLLRRLATEAGLPAEVVTALTPHVGRHTTAELARAEGHDVHEIMELLGHASIVTTQRYLHGSGERIPANVAAVVDAKMTAFSAGRCPGASLAGAVHASSRVRYLDDMAA